MFFSENIKNIRTVWGFGQAELGDLLGVSQNSISNYEKGTNVPNLDTAMRLSDLLGVPVQRFMREKLTFSDIPSKPLDKPLPDTLAEPEQKTAIYQKIKSGELGEFADLHAMAKAVHELQADMDAVKKLIENVDGVEVMKAFQVVIQFLESGMKTEEFMPEKLEYLGQISALLAGYKKQS